MTITTIGNTTLYLGDCLHVLRSMPEASIQCCVTSPPYFGLRDYGHDDQIGLERTPDDYVAKLVAVFREVRRVLRDDGTLWLNLGDSYASGGGKASPHRDSCGGIGKKGTRGQQPYHSAGGGFERPASIAGAIKPKDLVGIPWRVAFALQADGWYLRQDIIWHKPNPMPESVTDRCTKAHEYLFLLSKSERYFFDSEAMKEPSTQPERAGKLERSFSTGKPDAVLRQDVGRAVMRSETRNRRSVWSIATQPYSSAHFAVMPSTLVEPCILAGSQVGDYCLDPFSGSGTVAAVANRLGRKAVGIELNPEYQLLAVERVRNAQRQPDLLWHSAA